MSFPEVLKINVSARTGVGAIPSILFHHGPPLDVCRGYSRRAWGLRARAEALLLTVPPQIWSGICCASCEPARVASCTKPACRLMMLSQVAPRLDPPRAGATNKDAFYVVSAACIVLLFLMCILFRRLGWL